MNGKGKTALKINRVARSVRPSRGLLFGALILAALLAFELFNFSTTDFALTDLMGDLRFVDIPWATILAIAFCAIDFAGIARLFTPERGNGEPKEVWYLFGAWLLAATMNAMLTWWGVTIAIISHSSLGGAVLDPQTMIEVVPVFVAIMVFVIRVLIIGTFSVAGNRLFSQASASQLEHQAQHLGKAQPLAHANPLPVQSASLKPLPKSDPKSVRPNYEREEPAYHPVAMSRPGQHPNRAGK